MRSRRDFLQVSALALGATVTKSWAATPSGLSANPDFTVRRPAVGMRRFTSAAVEAEIARVKSQVADHELGWIFENCYPNTLDTTVTAGELDGQPDTYVITGDIDAMWLRDSAAQVWPYLPLIKNDVALERLIAGVVNRHARCVRLDPYANAFYRDEKQISPWQHDGTLMKPGVHERKWEVDSLCSVIRLAHGFWKAGGDRECFRGDWLGTMRTIVATFVAQQRKAGPGPYRFRRGSNGLSDTSAGGGLANLALPNGLICSAFRPSDDGTIFPYLVPSNFYAAASLEQLSELAEKELGEKDFAQECRTLAGEIRAALRRSAVVELAGFGKILAYEVDGFGSRYLIDDANVPSLLSLPYLKTLEAGDRELYTSTRRFVLSSANPYFVTGSAASGVSGPHVGRDMIWPMGIILRALTSSDDGEIATCLKMLRATHAGTGFMHESFFKDDPQKFSRKWFAWANSLFGELLIKVLDERPHLLR